MESAGQHHLHGAAYADYPRIKLVVRRAHGTHRRIAYLRILGDVDQIAAGRELGATGQAIAVHLGDQRLV